VTTTEVELDLVVADEVGRLWAVAEEIAEWSPALAELLRQSARRLWSAACNCARPVEEGVTA
jgi:hypothetical protein